MLTYVATPRGKLISVNWSIAAGMAAATASIEYHVRNIRSMKVITVNDMVEMTRGKARATTSRPPQGRRHQS